jgi:dihydrofolate reductase
LRKLTVFNTVSLDGYFTDANGDARWAHQDDAEWQAFEVENVRSGGSLLLGRVTYELMVAFWLTQYAQDSMPVVAEWMNSSPKFVFSRTLSTVAWHNTTLVKGDLATEIRRLKSEPGPEITILGSGNIVAQLAQVQLIDEYRIVVSPMVLGQGRSLFEGVKDKLRLKRTMLRVFGNGNVLLSYEPAA